MLSILLHGTRLVGILRDPPQIATMIITLCRENPESPLSIGHGAIWTMEQDESGDAGVSPPPLLRAVEYVRMSTEHQQYSTENQADKIREYAARRGIEIVRTYTDVGKSGLRIDGRASLQQLIKDVESGTADFTIILVYDVSRWGRFQDADESAYYVAAEVMLRWQARWLFSDPFCLPHRA